MRFAAAVLLASTLASQARAGDEKAATDFEAKAFAAVDAKQWCEAVTLFVAADQNTPTPELVVNAAQAAEQGGDRARALSLYAGVLARLPDAKTRAQVKKRIDAVAARVEKEGPGTACPDVIVTPPPPPPTTTIVTPPAPVETTKLTPETAVTTTATTTPATTPPAQPQRSVLPLVAVGGGGALIVVGGALAVVGSLPYFAHENAVAAVEEAQRENDVAAAAAQQTTLVKSRADWEGFGALCVIVGSGAVITGVGAAAIGGMLMLGNGE